MIDGMLRPLAKPHALQPKKKQNGQVKYAIRRYEFPRDATAG
jgi:hypothetical protein